MLCLERHTKKDVELAWAYDNPEANGKKLFTVFYTPRYKGTALIEHEDSRSLLEDDALMIMTEFSLSKDEYDHLVSHISHNGVSDQDWPTRLKRAYLRISAAIDEKLKKEIKFDLTEKVHLRPAWNTAKERTNYITSFFGSSGSGKTFALTSLLINNPSADYIPRVFLFSAVGHGDPAYEACEKFFKERFEIVDVKDMKAEDFDTTGYERGSALIFDDIDSIANKRIRGQLQEFRDNCLERARHMSQIILCTAHLFHNRTATQRLRNSSRYMGLFPRATPKVLLSILDQNHEIGRARRMKLVRELKRDSRMVWYSSSHPQHLLSERRIILL